MNQRTKLTKQIIKQSFFMLLKEKPVSKITVTKICEESGINRTTFYKYYLDVWDLLDQIESDLAFEMNLFIEKAANHTLTDSQSPLARSAFDVGCPDGYDFKNGIVYILKAIRANGDKYLLLASDHGDPRYIKDILKKWYDGNGDMIGRMLPGLDGVKRVWLYDFITQGDTAVVMDWIEGGMVESDETVATFINQLNHSLINQALKVIL